MTVHLVSSDLKDATKEKQWSYIPNELWTFLYNFAYSDTPIGTDLLHCSTYHAICKVASWNCRNAEDPVILPFPHLTTTWIDWTSEDE